WLLGELDSLIEATTQDMDKFQFDEAIKAIRAFAWDVLADNYIELVKARLYGPDGPEKMAAQNTLYTAIETLMKLMAPIAPFLSEEIYHSMTKESVHLQSWPEPSGAAVDTAGLVIKEIAAVLRRYKAENGMALNAPLPRITVFYSSLLDTIDLTGVANSAVESRTGKPEIELKPVAVKPLMKVLGPKFKDRSGRIIKALSGMDPAEVKRQKASGEIRVEVDGEALGVPAEAVEVVVETLSAGEAVDVLNVSDATVLVRR
ncbi:MAG TPA: class I tRNA ligase family protein, partial [Methanothrix sp.]|nr:class I tRNA ligase family protein [Methanothrix sp.]